MPYKNPEDKREHSRKTREHRKKIIDDVLGSSCIKCGSTKNLQIDHIDRNKKYERVSYLLTHKEETLRKELAKCQRLCKPCHAEKTAQEVYGLQPDEYNQQLTLICPECGNSFQRSGRYIRTHQKLGHQRMFCGQRCKGLFYRK